MEAEIHKENYYQCTKCGRLHLVDVDKVVDLGDDLYFGIWCSKCNSYTKHLWCGNNEENKYELIDTTFDERYY